MFKIKNIIANRTVIKAVTDELITFFVTRKIIPDIILDVITSNKILNNYGLNSIKNQIS